MTTIIAVHDEKGTKFAWDSQTTWQGRGMTGADKVFRNGPVVFGAAGSARTLDVLKYMDIPSRDEHNPAYDTERWVIRKLVPAIVKELKDVGAAYISDSQVDTEGSLIIAVDDVVGYLSSNLAFVQEGHGLYGVGSGSAYALGALAAGLSPKKAVQVAAAFDLYTGGDVRSKTVKEFMK